jgi:hypothetical protein
MMRNVLSLVILMIVCCVPAALGNTIFVSVTGDDANPCTSAMPCRTIQAGVNKAANGDVVSIGPGTFLGEVDINDRASLRLIGAGPATIVQLTGPNAAPVVAVNNSKLIDFTDLRLSGNANSDGFRIFYSTSVTFNRVTVDNNGGPGGGFFVASSLGVQINDSTIENNGTGIRVDGSSEVNLNSAPFSPGTSIVQGNNVGVIVRSGNFFWHGAGIIQNNGTGINGDGGTIKFCCEGGDTKKLINNETGLLIRMTASADVRGPIEISGNAITGIRQFGGVVVVTGHVLMSGNGTEGNAAIQMNSGQLQLNGPPDDPIRIINNAGFGVLGIDNATVRIQNTTITGNSNNGVRVQALSTLLLIGNVTISGNQGFDMSCGTGSFGRGDSSGVATSDFPGFGSSPCGPAGPQGPAGPGLAGVEYVTGTPLLIVGGESGTANVSCPSGKKLLTGGYSTTVPAGSTGTPDLLRIFSSYFDTTTMSWKVSGSNEGKNNGGHNESLFLSAYAVCASAN